MTPTNFFFNFETFFQLKLNEIESRLGFSSSKKIKKRYLKEM
jgi:hypothetical protein